MQKLYVYVDESGQDTGGVFFVVVAVVIADHRESINKKLIDIEKISTKRITKWHGSSFYQQTHYNTPSFYTVRT